MFVVFSSFFLAFLFKKDMFSLESLLLLQHRFPICIYCFILDILVPIKSCYYTLIQEYVLYFCNLGYVRSILYLMCVSFTIIIDCSLAFHANILRSHQLLWHKIRMKLKSIWLVVLLSLWMIQNIHKSCMTST